MKAPGPPSNLQPAPRPRECGEKKLPQDPTIGVPGGRKDTREPEIPRRGELRRERGQAETGGRGANRHLAPERPNRQRAAPRPNPRPPPPRRGRSRDTAKASGKGGGGEGR